MNDETASAAERKLRQQNTRLRRTLLAIATLNLFVVAAMALGPDELGKTASHVSQQALSRFLLVGNWTTSNGLALSVGSAGTIAAFALIGTTWNWRRTWALRKLLSGVGRLLVGKDLHSASRAWVSSVRSAERPSDLLSDESADLGSAIFRRAARISLVGLVVAAAPMILLLGQNLLMWRQLRTFESDTEIVRRVQLLQIIYECAPQQEPIDEAVGSPVEIDWEFYTPSQNRTECLPRAPVRLRQEAVRALAQIERNRGRPLNLMGANLEGAQLASADFTKANLEGANFKNADLRYAKLRYAILNHANLRNSNLSEADLKNSSLWGAGLMNSSLWNADLKGANLRDANLVGANLVGARSLHLAGSCGDPSTKIPEGIVPPLSWREFLPDGVSELHCMAGRFQSTQPKG